LPAPDLVHRPSATRVLSRTRIAIAIAALASASPALAQEGSLPRGEGGAIVKPAEEPKAPAGQPTMPRPLNYTPPRYPAEAEAQGLEATVTLELDVDSAGRVTRAVVVDPAGHGFDESALEAAKALQFEPARWADGAPFAARILYRYTFQLRRAEPPPEAPPPAPEAPAAPSLRGAVLASQGDVPLAGATVTLTDAEGRARTATTDATGAFAFTDLTAGGYKVAIRGAGFAPLDLDEDLREPLDVRYRLAAEGQIEVTVRGSRPPREVVKRTLEQREISRIPGTNGDALRSIQSLPGVARSPGVAGILLVRGSGPQDTQTFIDGTPVPLIYHFGGLSSVVPTEMLEKIDFYPGNFSAQYGRVMGGIVDAGIRSPKDDGGYHGLAQVDLIDARALVEGPVPLLDGWTFTAAGRRSYVDAWLGPVLEAAGAGVTQAPVYYDYQFVLEKDWGRGGRFRTAFFGSDDALEVIVNDPQPGEPALSGNVGLHTAFKRLQLRYENELSGGIKLRGLTALGQDNIEFGLGQFFFNLDVRTLTGRLEASARLSKGVTLNVGGDSYWALYDVALRAPGQPRPGEPPNQPFSTRAVREVSLSGEAGLPAGYVELELDPDPRLKVVPGVRVDMLSTNAVVDVSPRLSARYAVIPEFPKTTAKLGIGVFHQPPQFQEVIEPLGTESVRSNRSIQYGLGVEQELTRHVEVSLEGFFKQLDSLVVGQTNDASTTLDYLNTGWGYAAGSELLLKYKPDERFFGWAAYTLSRSVRTDAPGEAQRQVPWDQTHILTVLGSYKLGHGWEIGARFRLVSGNLVTPFVCNVQVQQCDAYRTNALFHAASGAYTPIPYSGPASERLPPFHQLDVRVDKRWVFKSWQLSAYLDVQNVYNRGNPEAIAYSYDYTGRTYVAGLPLLPSLGLRADF
jgi:TonB family protein